MRRVVITSIKSGGGKTTFTCGLIRALKKRGLKVCARKCGPDYIDPMFHRMVLGVGSGNLDPYFVDEEMLRYGRYPIYLKKRILSDEGHLSNEACSGAVARFADRGTKRFFLAHLSRENNRPELALAAVRARAGEALSLTAAPRDAYTEAFELD